MDANTKYRNIKTGREKMVVLCKNDNCYMDEIEAFRVFCGSLLVNCTIYECKKCNAKIEIQNDIKY